MATNLISLSLSPWSPLHFHPHPKPLLSFPHSALARTDAPPSALRSGSCWRRWRWRRRGEVVVVRSGPPSTTSLIIAFVLPLSLLVGTILTSIRIADNLDEQFLEELAMNKAIMEEIEAGDDGDGDPANTSRDGIILPPEEGVVTVPRTRNRPRREA